MICSNFIMGVFVTGEKCQC